MTGAGPLLDRRAIEEAFHRLGDRLVKRGVIADVYVFGGDAMALAYDARRATRDIDAVFKPHGIVLEEANTVADELGRPPRLVAQRAGERVCRTRWWGPVGAARVRPSWTSCRSGIPGAHAGDEGSGRQAP